MIHRVPFNLYVASCEKDGGIYHYRINELDEYQLNGFTPIDQPMYMVAGKQKMHVLLRAPFENNSESGLVSFNVSLDGELNSPTEIVSTQGEVACHLAVEGETVYVANYISGSVFKTPNNLVTHKGRGKHPQRQISPHTHFVTVTPDGKYLCVTDLGIDKIFIYNKDLSLKSSVSVPEGHGPRHLAFHKDGEHVFCANELMSTVSLLKYKEGKMKLIDTVAVLPKEFTGQSTVAAIRCERDKVYVSNRGHDSISVLSFDGLHLTFDRTFSSYGESPRDFLIYKGTIIIANERSHNVAMIDVRTDCVVENIIVKSPICVTVESCDNA